MSNFEIFLLVMACLIPIFPILAVIPKKLKNKKEKSKTKEDFKTLAEVKTEEKPKEVVTPKVEKEKPISSDISTDDFKNYLNHRKSSSKPSRVELPEGFKDRTSPFMPPRKRGNLGNKSVAEEIQGLSPRIKAMLIAGVLDKKDFDE